MSSQAKLTKAQKRAQRRANARQKQKTIVVKRGTVTPAKKKQNPPPQQRRLPPLPAVPGGAVASGGGAYHLSGNAAWNIPGFASGRLGGFVNDSVATGSGAYKVKSNSLMGAMDLTGTVPRVKNLQKGEAFVISHREFLKDIKSGEFEPDTELTKFDLESFSLNPANKDLFPWLANIAGNFQEYKITGMLVEFKTTCSDLSTTLSLGTVIMTADYNVLADHPINKQLMENMENAGSCKPSCSLIMPIECKRSLTSISNMLFVGPLEADDGDLRLYDMANIFLATAGLPKENVTIGELWVTYEVAFYKPKLLPYPIQQDSLSWSAQFAPLSNADPLPEVGFVLGPDSSSLISYFRTPTPAGIIRFPDVKGQKYAVQFFWRAAVPAHMAMPELSGEGMTAIDLNSIPNQYLTAPEGASGGSTYSSMSAFYLVEVVATDDDPRIPYLAFVPGTGTYGICDLFVYISLWNRKYNEAEPGSASLVYNPKPLVIADRQNGHVQACAPVPRKQLLRGFY